MRRLALLAALGTSAPLLSGCVLAVVPMLAGTTMAGTGFKARRQAQAQVAAAMPTAAARPAAVAVPPTASPAPLAPAPNVAVAPRAGEALVVPSATPPAFRPPVPGTSPSAARFVPGSADSAAQSMQAWAALGDYLGRAAARYRDKAPQRQQVIVDGASLAAPYFEPCGAKPPAVVIDIDESARADLGFDAAAGPPDADGWQRWDTGNGAQVAAAPGAAAALAAARAAGIDVIFNSNRATAQAADTVAALTAAGLGPVEHYKTLWMRGDDGGGAEKDNRRWAIASGYCVVALVGDELGDFSDEFNAKLTPARRRVVARAPTLASLWGNGWFVVPNAVHGAAPKGTP